MQGVQKFLSSTYLEKLATQTMVPLLGRKKLTLQGVMSVMTHHFFELSRHPLQG
jgi:hypothetical protein